MTRATKIRIAKWVSGFALTLIMLVALLHTPPVRQFALRQAVQILGKQGVRFNASRFGYNLLSMRADLRDVVVQSPQAPDLPPLLKADEVNVNLSLRKLLTGAYYIEDAFIQNPQVHVVVDETGRTNIPKLPEKQNEPKSDIDYLIDDLKITGGSLRFEDRRQKISADLPLNQLTVDGNPVTGNHDIRLQANPGGAVRMEARTLALNSLTADVQLQENAADVRSLRIGVGESTVAFSGKLNNFDDPRFDVRADTTLALGALSEFAGVQQRVSGTIQASLEAQGPIEQLVATARVSGDDLSVDRFDRLDLQAEATYRAAQSRVSLDSLNLVSPSGTVRGTANLALNTRAGTSTANISASSLNLAQLSRMFDAPVVIASTGTARIAANWPALQFERAAGDATIRLTPTRSAPAKDVVPVRAALNVQTRGNRVVAGISDLAALNAQAKGQVTITDRRSLAGDVQLQAPDLSSTVASLESLLGRQPGTLLGTPLRGTANVNARLGGTVQAPAAQATVDAPALSVGDLQGIDVHAEAGYRPDLLTVQALNVNWRNQSLNASGTVGLKQAEPQLDLTVSTQNVTIESVLAGLNRTGIPASGTLSLDAQVRGTTKRPQADVQLTATSLSAYNETFGTLDAQVRLENQVATVNRLRLVKPQEGGDGTLQATGSYNLDSKDYQFGLTSENLKLTSLTLPDGRPVRGNLSLNGKGQGNVDDPAANVELAAGGLQVGEIEVGDTQLTASVANRNADIDVSLPKFNLSADAQIGTEDPYPATFVINAKGTDLASLPVKIEQPVTGTITAEFRGTANLKNPEQGQGTAEVAQLNLTWNGQPIRSDGPLRASYANEVLTVENANLVAGESRVQLQGKLPVTPAAGEGEIRLTARLDLPTLVQYVPSEKELTARGTAVIDGTIRGTLKRIDPNVTISLQDGYLYTEGLNPPISDASLQATIQNGVLQLEKAAATWGVGTFAASGTVPFALLPANLPVELPRGQGPAQLTAELKAIDLASIEGLPDTVYGTISARLEAQAAQPTLEAITGTLSFPELRVGVKSYAVEQEGTSQIRIANAQVQIAQLHLTGPNTDVTVTGTAGLTGQRPLDLRVLGDLDASIISAFADDIRAQGPTQLELAVTGTAQQPKAQGFVQLADGNFSLQQPRVAAENLNLRVDLDGTRATISQLNGLLNGGALSGGGSVEYAAGGFRNTNVKISVDDVYMDFPEGLKTISDVNLTLRNANEDLVLGGEVVVQEGGFTDDLDLDRGILAAIGSTNDLDLTKERNQTLEDLRFNIAVRTANPLIIENNLAEAEVTADLRVLGNPYQPGLSGRLTIEEGSELRLQERSYAVERGAITFTNERKIEPSLDILATTSAEGYDIRLQITGQPGDTETTLTSDPPLGEPEILALLLTGRTLDEIRGQEFDVARNQVLSYLTGRVGGVLGRGIAGATGLSTVRIEPNLIANETDPSARLTVGQDITRNLELIYSMDLVNSSDQIYVAEYDITKRFTARGVRQSDGSVRFDFRHDLRFGGIPEPRRDTQRNQRRIGNLTILGEEYFTEKQIADKFKVKPGKRYDYFDIRKGVDRVQEMYTKEQMLESRVRLRRNEQGQLVDLTLQVQPGPRVSFVFEGIGVPGGVREDVEKVWRDGVFDTQRAEEALDVLRAWLVEENYLRPEIQYTIDEVDNKQKRVLFDIQPGAKFRDVELAFDGAAGVEQDKLRDVVKNQKLTTEVYTAPGRVSELLTRYYREVGYMDGEVSEPRYELNPETRTGRVVFPVKEGPLYRVGTPVFEGNSVLSDEQLAAVVPLPKGEPFRPILRENAVQRIREAYWELGYNDLETETSLRRSPDTGTVDLVFNIGENRQSVVYDVVIEGNDKTSENLIQTQLEVKPGNPLSLQKLGESRRNLYNTGAYSLVEIIREDVDTDGGPTRQVRLRVRVREIQPFELRYGGLYDTERGVGLIADFSNRNTLGSARVLGLRTRWDSQLREARIYFSQPQLLRFPVRTIVSPYVRRELNPETTETDPFNVDRIGFSVQQEARFWNNYLLNYGFNHERSRTYDTTEDGIFDVPLRVSSLTTSLSHETRDEILDATRGSFMSHAIQLSPEMLGSDTGFIKYFAQYFRYVPLQRERVELFTNRILRPRFVYAGGVRVGLATGFGDAEVPRAERFFAGGSNTIRGFEQNTVGPISGSLPTGGEAMLVINNEVRFPLISIFDGVAFMDIGNVYPTVADLRLTDIRKTAGLGLRLRTPWFLIRMDYGHKLDRRPGETAGRLFFSIGQAF